MKKVLPAVRSLIATTLALQQELGTERLGVHHWLLALLEHHKQVVASLVPGLDCDQLAKELRRRLGAGVIGKPLKPESAVNLATIHARAEGRKLASVADVAAVIVRVAKPTAEVAEQAAAASSQETSSAFRAEKPTPALDEFGRDLTQLAQSGDLPEIVGREREMRALCRRTKRNPALVGPAGCGKTAIVEGLAQRIVTGTVPEPLQGLRIVELQHTALTAGAGVRGDLQKRMKAILEEAGQDGIVLFVDELHSMVGSGGHPGREDVASLLKPALARGEIACIGATTDDEYRAFIEPDRALERRFYPIRVQELSPEDTLTVLKVHRDLLAELRSVEVSDAILEWMVGFAAEFLRNRAFPDKAVDVLEQCVAAAVVDGESQVGTGEARAVGEELVGMPVALDERLDEVETELAQSGWLGSEQQDALLNRLNVTLRGLDLKTERPAAVVMLAGKAASGAGELAEMLARTLFGAPERIVEVDFSSFERPEDVNTLLGPPPGYIGYGERLPLHEVAQMPWCVLLCRNVDLCHPQVREVLAQALDDGRVVERTGKRIYLSDSLVLLTATGAPETHRSMGFDTEGEEATRHQGVKQLLGDRLAARIDLICAQAPAPTERRREWVEEQLLGRCALQYRSRGLALQFDASLVDWVLEQQRQHDTSEVLTRLVEDRLGRALMPHLREGGEEERRLLVSVEGEELVASAED